MATSCLISKNTLLFMRNASKINHNLCQHGESNPYFYPYLQNAVSNQGDPNYTYPCFTSLVTCLLGN